MRMMALGVQTTGETPEREPAESVAARLAAEGELAP